MTGQIYLMLYVCCFSIIPLIQRSYAIPDSRCGSSSDCDSDNEFCDTAPGICTRCLDFACSPSVMEEGDDMCRNKCPTFYQQLQMKNTSLIVTLTVSLSVLLVITVGVILILRRKKKICQSLPPSVEENGDDVTNQDNNEKLIETRILIEKNNNNQDTAHCVNATDK